MTAIKKRYRVKNICKHCGTHEEYEIDAVDADEAEMSMENFSNHKESLGNLVNESVTEL